MDNDKDNVAWFVDLIERRTGVRLLDADAHALYLKIMPLYRLLIRKPPRRTRDRAPDSDGAIGGSGRGASEDRDRSSLSEFEHRL